MKKLFFLILLPISLLTESFYPFKFNNWKGRELELISLFLPRDLTILAEPEKALDLWLFWPQCQLLASPTQKIDLVYDPGSNISHQIATCIYGPNKDEISGFKQVSDCLFVKEDFFYNNSVKEFIQKTKIKAPEYQIFYEPSFKVNYCLERVTGDSIKNILKQGLAYEGNIGLMIEQLTIPGSIAIDVGAHIGVHTMTMSRKTGNDGVVIAFEPDKKSYLELLTNLTLNKCTNVIPICKALGDNSHLSLLNEHRKIEEVGDGELVETIPLDSLNLTNVSLIKMDIENYEFFAFQGAKETLHRNKPVIIFECWIGKDYEKTPPKEKANFDRVIDLLESYGYEIYVIFCNDFIAFHKSRDDLNSYKKNFKKLDRKNFDIGL